MTRFFLAALALACACSPAMAMGLLPAHGRDPSAVSAGLAHIGTLICLAAFAMSFVGILSRRIVVGTVAAAVAVFSLPSLGVAAEVATIGNTAVVVPYGPWIVAFAGMARDILVPLLTAVILAVVAKLYPLGRMFLSEALVERTLHKWFDYGINATAGATKGSTVSVNVGAVVVANALQRGVDRADASAVSRWVMQEAGGQKEVARKLFRLLHLEEGADAEAVVPPALEKVGAVPADELRDAERMTRG